MIDIQPHPLLDAAAIKATFPRPLGESESPAELLNKLSVDFSAPVSTDDETKKRVRELLRHGGYKPSGRGKPASEYLVRAVSENKLGSINPVVDALNITSLHCGLPISVIDLDLANDPLSISIAPPDSEYVFNASGQTISLKGLLCLNDQDGPCANAVKDSQRTKTNAETTKTLSIIWGTNALVGQTQKATDWYCELLQLVGATVERVEL